MSNIALDLMEFMSLLIQRTNNMGKLTDPIGEGSASALVGAKTAATPNALA